jgi:hypothetical protein
MDNPETLAMSGTQDTGWRQTCFNNAKNVRTTTTEIHLCWVHTVQKGTYRD